MNGEPNAVEIRCWPFKPFCSGPCRGDAIDLRLLMVQAYFELEQLPTGNGAHMIDRFQVIEHISAGYATQQVKAELVAQEAADSHKMFAVNIERKIITLESCRCDRLTNNLCNRS